MVNPPFAIIIAQNICGHNVATNDFLKFGGVAIFGRIRYNGENKEAILWAIK
jgi:hypothetical protein